MLLTDNHRTSQNQPFFSEAAGDVLSPHRKRSLDRIKPSLPHSSTFQPSKSNQPKKNIPSPRRPRCPIGRAKQLTSQDGPHKKPRREAQCQEAETLRLRRKKRAGGVSGVRHLKEENPRLRMSPYPCQCEPGKTFDKR